MPAPLKTERLALRPLTLADAARIARFTSDFAVARMVTSIPHPNPGVAAEGWILMMQARRPLARDHVFAIDLPGEGLVGCIGIHAKGDGAWELGYWIGRPYWGRGFATEAARALAAQGRRSLAGELVSGHFEDNPASGRVLQKAGFVYTGEARARFSLARGAKAVTLMMRYAS